MTKKRLLLILPLLIMSLLVSLHLTKNTYADTDMLISPMYQKTVLIPGRTEEVFFTLANPSGATQDLDYELDIRPFSVDNKNSVSFTAKEDYSQILEWVKLEKTAGTLKPNEKEEIAVKIKVPEDAPAGGQYIAIIARAKPDTQKAVVNNVFEASHLIYAEVAGETIRKGIIGDPDVKGFMLSGNITAGVAIENVGNVHSEATHVLRIFPLFSDEEYYTNEEEPQTNLIMPGVQRYTSVTWDKTPSVGIFRVVYTVEFEGVTKELSKVVVICPIWLLFIIIGAIILLIIFAFITVRKKIQKASKQA